MEKLSLFLIFILLSGCSNGLIKPEKGTMAVYKRYNIVIPPKPELTVDKLSEDLSIGEVSRSYQNDLTNIIEYSLQLENILKPIAESEDGYVVSPSKGFVEQK